MYQHLSTHKFYAENPKEFEKRVRKSYFHLDIYIYSAIMPAQTDLFGKQGEYVSAILSAMYPFKISPDIISAIRRDKPPSTKYLVQRLYMLGFRQDFISSVLNISQPTVSYHLNTPVKRIYLNQLLDTIIDQEYDKLFGEDFM